MTEAGCMVYRFATEIVAKYEEMQVVIQKEVAKQQGAIRFRGWKEWTVETVK